MQSNKVQTITGGNACLMYIVCFMNYCELLTIYFMNYQYYGGWSGCIQIFGKFAMNCSRGLAFRL